LTGSRVTEALFVELGEARERDLGREKTSCVHRSVMACVIVPIQITFAGDPFLRIYGVVMF
jgi:hypothetical protein